LSKNIIVIPTYNEEDNIVQLVESLSKIDSDIIFVDDNSPDETQNIIKQLKKFNTSIFLIGREGKNGYASACIEGFLYGLKNEYDYIIQMDADLSHSAEDLEKLIELSEENDLVIGSRYTKNGRTSGWGLSRVLLSRIANIFSKFYLKQDIRDLTSGFRVYRAEILQIVELEQLKSEGYGFLVEILYKISKFTKKIKEVPIHFNDRKFGQSKMNSKIIFEAIKLVIFLPFKR
jgi:dolichol-phosphate mannosyltransferase